MNNSIQRVDLEDLSLLMHGTYISEPSSSEFESTDGGKSDFDEEYKDNMPTPQVLETSSILVVEPFQLVENRKKRRIKKPPTTTKVTQKKFSSTQLNNNNAIGTSSTAKIKKQSRTAVQAVNNSEVQVTSVNNRRQLKKTKMHAERKQSQNVDLSSPSSNAQPRKSPTKIVSNGILQNKSGSLFKSQGVQNENKWDDVVQQYNNRDQGTHTDKHNNRLNTIQPTNINRNLEDKNEQHYESTSRKRTTKHFEKLQTLRKNNRAKQNIVEKNCSFNRRYSLDTNIHSNNDNRSQDLDPETYDTSTFDDNHKIPSLLDINPFGEIKLFQNKKPEKKKKLKNKAVQCNSNNLTKLRSVKTQTDIVSADFDPLTPIMVPLTDINKYLTDYYKHAKMFRRSRR